MKEHLEELKLGGRTLTKNEIKIKDLQQRIDKAIEYINKITLVILKDYEKYKDTPLKNTMIGKDLLEILGGED